MSLFDTDFTAGAEAAVGKPSGFFENVAQGYEQQYRVDSPYSLEAEVEQRYKESIDAFFQATGERPSFRMDLAALNSYARTQQGEDISFWQRELVSGNVSEDLLQSIQAFQQFNDKIKANGNPDILSFEQVLEEVFEMQREVERQSGILSETSSIGGAIGQFIGATAGTISSRDPLTLATLGVGGVGRAAATRILTAGAAAGTITAATEFGAVQGNRELAGLEERNPLFDVAVSAAAGGIFEGAGIVLSKLLRRRSDRIESNRQADEAEREAADARTRQIIEGLSDPRARGVRHLLDMEDAVINASPYGKSRPALLRFTAELEEVQGIFQGKTDTAIGRFLPPVPFDQLKRAADLDILKQRSPEIYERLEVAQARVESAQAEIDNIQENFPNLEDAIESLDPPTGELVRSFLNDLEQPGLTTAKKIEIEKQLKIITESLDEGVLAKQLNDLQILPKKTLKARRAGLKAANKQYKKAFNEVEAERARFNNEQAAIEKIEQMQMAEGLVGTVREGAPVRLSSISPEAVQDVASKIQALDADIEASASAVIAAYDPQAKTVSIGMMEEVDAGFKFVDETGKTVSVKEAMDDLSEDIRLEEAMRSCSI